MNLRDKLARLLARWAASRFERAADTIEEMPHTLPGTQARRIEEMAPKLRLAAAKIRAVL